MTVLRGGKRLATKINLTFFVGIDVLNIFRLTPFLKKTLFSTIRENFVVFFGGGGVTIFEGTGRRTTKMNLNFLFGKWCTKYSFQVFFSKNPIPANLHPKNWFWEHIFPHSCGWFYWADYFQQQYTYIFIYKFFPCKITKFGPQNFHCLRIRPSFDF